MVIEHNLSLVKKVNRLLSWGHWFSFFNILLALAITSVYWLSEPSPETLLGWLYLLCYWLGHTAFVCFMFFIITIFPLSLIFPYQKHVRGLAAILATMGMVVLIFDAYVYANLGYHIGSTSYDQTIELLRQQVVTNLRNFILIVACVAAILIVIELTISNYCWKKIARLKQSPASRPLLVIFIGSFMLSHVIHIYADARLKWDVTKLDNVLPFSYPATAKTFLARYQLVDLAQRAQRQADRLSITNPELSLRQLQCAATSSEPVLVIIANELNIQTTEFIAKQGLRSHGKHFAPNNRHEALLNILYGQFLLHDQSQQQLTQPPAFIEQLPLNTLSISSFSAAVSAQLPWLGAANTAAAINIVFDDTPAVNWQTYQHYKHIMVLPLTSQQSKFVLAPVEMMIRWPALKAQLKQHSSQHLDILPTLLSSAGCYTERSWLGDDLLQTPTLPKLSISLQDIVSIRKDKMVVLRQDGSFGVWSAGTLLPLNERLDTPMLIDALKRLEPVE
jgi:membrane-anchored protein YejM (alkaline phosphatase superfamily)